VAAGISEQLPHFQHKSMGLHIQVKDTT